MQSGGSTQNEQVLKHLQEVGPTTSWERIQRYGITRLSARIQDLEKAGHAIGSEMRHENGKHFKVYWLERPKGQLEMFRSSDNPARTSASKVAIGAFPQGADHARAF